MSGAEDDHSPPDFATVLRRGHQLYAAKDYEGAATSFRLALELEPDSLNTVVSLGHTLVMMERPAEALVLAEEALRQHPSQPRLLMLIAPLRLRQGDTRGAIAAYEDALPLIAEDGLRQHAAQGLEHARQRLAIEERQAAAAPARQAAAPAGPSLPGDALLRGSLAEAREALAGEEQSWLAHALEQVPPPAEEGKPGRAPLARLWDRLTRGRPGRARDAAAEAHRLLRRGLPLDGQAAEAAALRAARLAPRDGLMLLRLGALLAHFGRDAGAVPLLRRGAELAPEIAGSHLVLSSALARLGRREEAQVAICLASEQMPADPRVARHFAFHMLACGDDVLAERGFRTALRARQDPSLLPWLVRALVAQGREREALEAAEAMVTRVPRDARPLLLTGLLRLRLGDAAGAVPPLEASLGLPHGDAAMAEAALAAAREIAARPPPAEGPGQAAALR